MDFQEKNISIDVFHCLEQELESQIQCYGEEDASVISLKTELGLLCRDVV